MAWAFAAILSRIRGHGQAMSFFTELQRRNVVRVGVAYTLIAWVIAQVAEFAFENFGAPDWVIKVVVVLMLLGLPLVLVFAWIYEMTPEGLRKEKDVDRTSSITPQTGRRIDRVIIVVLVLALGFFAADKYLWHAHTDDVVAAAPVAEALETAEPVQADAGPPEKSVAVLPFIAMSDGPDDEFFADGLTEEILNSLAQLPELLVTARTSAFVFKGDDLPPVPEIAEQLGVKHVVEGSVRRSGDRLRVTAQLIRASDGFHLWSNNYDSTSADAIQVQENIAEKIAVALDVVLDDEKMEAMRKAGLRDVEAFTAYQKGIKLFNEAHGQIDIVSGLRAANEHFDKVIERVPNYPDVYARHSDLYTHMMNDDVWGERGGLYTEEEAAAAYPAAIADLQAALRHTDNRDEVLKRELDLAFVQGNWRGLVARTRRALEADVCDESNWMSSIANVVGLSEAHVEQSNRIVACDPLRSISWFNLARALLWAGRYEEAIEASREGMERAPGLWVSWVHARALIESGRFEEARVAIDTQMQDPTWAQSARILLAAKQGDREALDAAIEVMANDVENIDNNFFTPLIYAWSGRRDDANRIAARFDSHPWGPWVLWQTSNWCACGNAFDLEVTPNFARMINDSDVNWPPRSGREYPLKDW
jgi:adenylate cyclase